jgi:2-iminoacetate synthase
MIIDIKRISDILSDIDEPNRSTIDSILAKASFLNGLSLEDAASLLSVKSIHDMEKILRKAGEIKEKVFGTRIVIFAPLYLSNYCVNNCLYCGFRKDNKGASRKALTMEEVIQEANALAAQGFKRVLLVCGEDNRISGIEYIIEAVDAIYKNTGIRIVHVNAPPMEVGDLRRLKAVGVGVYQVFQETYHRPTYEAMHPTGKKRDYDYRLDAVGRAMEAGFEDVGIGALLGLYDYKYDVLATIAHAQYLYRSHGSYAHTISVPRLRPADGSPITTAPHPVSDTEFKEIVAVYRLAVPSAGIVISTREGAGLRDEVVGIGASQISAGSRTEPGGYAKGGRGQWPVGTDVPSDVKGGEQFSTNDHRTMEEMIASIAKNGYLPSLCAACYRVGRTGADFTKKAISGEMEKFCQANAILTLQEYILDCANNGAKEIGAVAIERGLEQIREPALKNELLSKLGEIKRGKRDVYF